MNLTKLKTAELSISCKNIDMEFVQHVSIIKQQLFPEYYLAFIISRGFQWVSYHEFALLPKSQPLSKETFSTKVSMNKPRRKKEINPEKELCFVSVLYFYFFV